MGVELTNYVAVQYFYHFARETYWYNEGWRANVVEHFREFNSHWVPILLVRSPKLSNDDPSRNSKESEVRVPDYVILSNFDELIQPESD